jgi:hydrogenase expression/formation protein HypE
MNDTITLAHGAGGTQTAALIDGVFRANFDNPAFTSDDAAMLDFSGGTYAFTTDGFIVSPWSFPGGNIGKLSVCGTVNDLACMGAQPLWISCAFVIEEGFAVKGLETIAESMAAAAKEAGAGIVAGDTKVAGRGQCGGIFITTSGIGRRAEGVSLSGAFAKPGDAVIVTRDIGRHGCAVLLARGDYGISADCPSDCAPLWGTVSSLISLGCGLHVIRDATRGGVGTVLHEIASQSGAGVEIDAESVPVSGEVSGVCGMLGLEPLYLACEGTLVITAPQDCAGRIVSQLRRGRYSRSAAVIGRVTDDMPGRVTVRTASGGVTLLPQPGGELLPRIC